MDFIGLFVYKGNESTTYRLEVPGKTDPTSGPYTELQQYCPVLDNSFKGQSSQHSDFPPQGKLTIDVCYRYI